MSPHRAHLNNVDFLPVVEAVMHQAGLNVARDRWDIRKGGSAHWIINMENRLSVRVAKSPELGAAVARRTETLRRLPYDLSFEVPRPITRTITRNGMTAVGLSWIKGEPHHSGQVSPRALATILREIHSIDYTGMEPYLDFPHQHWGGKDWVSVLRQDVVPKLLKSNQRIALGLIDDVVDLEPATPVLIHNDLAGHNILWSGDKLAGVIDWDHACLADPAYDHATLGMSYGWEALRRALSPDEMERALVLSRTLALEAVAYSLKTGKGGAIVRLGVERADDWLYDFKNGVNP